MVGKHQDLTQAEEVNDSGQKLLKVSPKDGERVFEVMVSLVYED